MNYSSNNQLAEDYSNSSSISDDFFHEDNLISENNCKIGIFEPKLEQYDSENKQIIKKRKRPRFCQHCKWTIDEDNNLCKLVKQFGENNWRHLAKKMEGRNSRQCRERWQYYLDPKLNVSKWTYEEDQLILSKFKEYGPKWMIIKNFFNNRTDAMIKNRYRALLKVINKKKENFFDFLEQKQCVDDQIAKSLSQKSLLNDFQSSNNSKKDIKTEQIDYVKLLNQNENPDDDENNSSNGDDFSIEMSI